MLLAIDTATTTASLALYDLTHSRLMGEWTWQARRRHTQDLLCAAQTLLEQADVAPAELTALAVTTGPGSFTGVRIGISTVKGMALGLVEPPSVVGIPTLNVTAAPWAARADAAGAQLCTCIQAGRGRFNWAYLGPDNALLTVEAHRAGTVADFVADLAAQVRPIWLAGETDPTLCARVAELASVSVLDPTSSLRRAGVLAQLASARIGTGCVIPLTALQPMYLRAP